MKRILAIALACVMVMSVMAGCSLSVNGKEVLNSKDVQETLAEAAANAGNTNGENDNDISGVYVIESLNGEKVPKMILSGLGANLTINRDKTAVLNLGSLLGDAMEPIKLDVTQNSFVADDGSEMNYKFDNGRIIIEYEDTVLVLVKDKDVEDAADVAEEVSNEAAEVEEVVEETVTEPAEAKEKDNSLANHIADKIDTDKLENNNSKKDQEAKPEIEVNTADDKDLDEHETKPQSSSTTRGKEILDGHYIVSRYNDVDVDADFADLLGFYLDMHKDGTAELYFGPEVMGELNDGEPFELTYDGNILTNGEESFAYTANASGDMIVVNFTDEEVYVFTLAE